MRVPMYAAPDTCTCSPENWGQPKWSLPGSRNLDLWRTTAKFLEDKAGRSLTVKTGGWYEQD